MTWTKDDLRRILRTPSATTDGVAHSLVIHRMVLALRRHRPDIFTSKFFNDVETRLRRRGHWTSQRELDVMARALNAYVDVLDVIMKQQRAALDANKKTEDSERDLKKKMHAWLDYLANSEGLVASESGSHITRLAAALHVDDRIIRRLYWEVVREMEAENKKSSDDILELPKDDISFSPAQFDDDEDILE